MTVVLWGSQQANPAVPGTFDVSTPIIVPAGGLIVASADGPSGLAGLSATIQQLDGTIIVNSSAVTITEDSSIGGARSRYTARAVAPLTAGTYQIAWANSGQFAASEPVVVEIGVRPSIERVASYIRARTKVKGGAELGTFTAATRPTDSQVGEFIDDALDEVLSKVQSVDPSLPAGDPMGPGGEYETRLRSLVALYAAASAEISLQPENVTSTQSVAALLQQRYESRLKALIAYGETGRAQGEGAGTAVGGDSPGDAFWTFPDAGPGGLVGYASRW